MSHVITLYKKLAASLLAVAVACTMALPAAAWEGEAFRQPEGQEAVSPLIEDVESQGEAVDQAQLIEEEAVVGEGLGYVDAAAFSAGAPSVDGSMYGRLNTRQRACYDALTAVSVYTILDDPQHRITLDIEGITGVQMMGWVDNGSFVPANETARATYMAVQNDMQAAIVALRYDRPDMPWLDGTVSCYTSLSVWGGVGVIKEVSYGFSLIYEETEASIRLDMVNAAYRLARQADKEPTTYLKVKAAHDLIANQARYLHVPPCTLSENLSHCAYSALIAGDMYEPVCDGYSKAFKMVLDELGIPCVLVSSETHMWNNVKMDDGRWYNVDLTWDDNDSGLKWDYFLIGYATPVSGQLFNQQASHIELDPFLEAGLSVGGQHYPSKSPNAYVYLGQDYAPPKYPDVGRDDWFFDDVETVSDLGYFQGDSYGKFNPNKNITRAEFAQVMANIWGIELGGYADKESFSDVQPEAWYGPVAAWAKESGLMQGDGGRLRPNDPITRQEICVVLYNAMGLNAQDTGFRFPDDGAIAGWASGQVYACYAAGLIKGDAQGNFNPGKNARRSEAATIFARYASL